MPHAAIGRALILAAALAAGGAGAQAMYKWVDEKGTTHFSEHPPADGKKATKVEPKVTPPSSEAASRKEDPKTWKAQDAEFRKRQIERNQREQGDKRERAQRDQECSNAKQRHAYFESSSAIYDMNDAGERIYLEESQRNAFMARLRAAVKDKCG